MRASVGGRSTEKCHFTENAPATTSSSGTPRLDIVGRRRTLDDVDASTMPQERRNALILIVAANVVGPRNGRESGEFLAATAEPSSAIEISLARALRGEQPNLLFGCFVGEN